MKVETESIESEKSAALAGRLDRFVMCVYDTDYAQKCALIFSALISGEL